MGGGSSRSPSPQPQIIYRTDPDAMEAMEAAQEAAELASRQATQLIEQARQREEEARRQAARAQAEAQRAAQEARQEAREAAERAEARERAAAQEAAAARQQAQEAARATAAQNAALHQRLEQLEERNAQNQREMTQAMEQVAEAARERNSKQLQRMEQQHQQEIEKNNRERQQMEDRFRRQMKSVAAENRAALEREQQQHRAQQKDLEEKSRRARLEQLKEQHGLINDSLLRIENEMNNTQKKLGEEESKLDSVKTLLVIEMKARSQFERIDVAGDVYKLVMIGKTGDGKSTLGNRLTGDRSRKGNQGTFATGACVGSVTQTIKTAFTKHGDAQFCIADTPGSDDSEGKDRVHATALVDFLHGIGSVSAFLMVRNVTNKRLSQSEQLILAGLEELLGKEFWRNMMIVFTRVDDEDAEDELRDCDRTLADRIGELFSLDRRVVQQIPVIGIGKRNFEQQSAVIFEKAKRCNDGRPFVCQHLVAPVEQRQEEFDQQQQVVNEIRNRMQELAAEKGNLEAQQKQVEEFLRDLSGRRSNRKRGFSRMSGGRQDQPPGKKLRTSE